MRLLLRQGLRHHRRHPLQTLLTLLGIAAGAALWCAMQLAQQTAERAFDRAVETVAGTATHTVTAGPGGVAIADYAAVRALLHGRGVAPVVTAIARVPDREDRTVLRVLGVDPLADAGLRPWSAAGQTGGPELGPFVTMPGGFVAVAPLLARLGVDVGGTLAITVGGRPFTARCLGAIAPPPVAAQGLQDVLVVDVATAQEWTGRLDRVDRLDLALPDDASRAATLATLRERLGPAVRLAAVGGGQGTLAALARGFRTNLAALSLLSLLVGAFLVHETMRLSVVARRTTLGVLRALGVRSDAIGLAVACEALTLGLVGSGLGALLGIGAAKVLLAPLVRTLNDHYATFSLATLAVDPWLVAAAIALGTGTALLAGLGPAFAAARIAPRDVLVPAHTTAPARRLRTLRWFVPAAILSVVLLLTVGDRLVQAYLGILALLVAAVAAVPPAMAAVLAVARWLTARSGPFVRYVVRSTAAAREHLALPVAAMVLAIATTIGLATLVGSFRDSVAGWLGQVLPADVYVSVPGGVDEKSEPIDPAVVAALREAPGVATATTYHRTKVRIAPARSDGDTSGEELEVVGVSPTPAFVASWPLLAGDGPAGRAALAGGEAWVSEPLAFRWRLAVGDELRLATDRGPTTIRVAATYRDYSTERGEVIVGSEWLLARANVGTTALGLALRAGADIDATVADLRARAAAASPQAVFLRAQRDLRASSLEVFDRTFAITSVMRILCLAVAFFGIYAAFATLQLERGAEIGLLRCLGALPSRIGLVVVGQTALLGLCAGLCALPLGALLGHVLARVVNRVSFGWSLVDISVPRGAIVEALVLAIAAAVLAGVQPAVRFARMRPVEALREA